MRLTAILFLYLLILTGCIVEPWFRWSPQLTISNCRNESDTLVCRSDLYGETAEMWTFACASVRRWPDSLHYELIVLVQIQDTTIAKMTKYFPERVLVESGGFVFQPTLVEHHRNNDGPLWVGKDKVNVPVEQYAIYYDLPMSVEAKRIVTEIDFSNFAIVDTLAVPLDKLTIKDSLSFVEKHSRHWNL